MVFVEKKKKKKKKKTKNGAVSLRLMEGEKKIGEKTWKKKELWFNNKNGRGGNQRDSAKRKECVFVG